MVSLNRIVGLFTRVWTRFLFSLKSLLCKRVVVFGDSHSQVYDFFNKKKLFCRYFFEINISHGATVSGLDNPNSKTKTNHKFNELISKESGQVIVINLGEVDTGFVIWYRAQKYKEDIEVMLNKALVNYKSLLIKASANNEVVCVSCPLPTITDNGDNLGEVANLRQEVKASQLERTKLTVEFNKRVKQYCFDNGIKYLSLDEVSISSNGVVNEFFLNDNKNDHHYSSKEYSKILDSHLMPILDSYYDENSKKN